jgi:sensor histidine kinase regulating citrate/malate metabolism
MKISLSTKIFVVAVAFIFIATIVTIFVKIQNNKNEYNDAIKTESLDNGKIISVEYTKTTTFDENDE